MEPVVLHTLAQSLPAFPGPNLRQERPSWLHPLPPFSLAETSYRRPMFVPRVQQLPELEGSFARWFQPRAHLPRWRIHEIERQREMDRIAEPYIARLREVSHQKKIEAKVRALDGRQKTNRADEGQHKSLKDMLREDEKKVQKELKEVERQQWSEEKRQARKNAREERRRKKSAENLPSEGQEPAVSVSPLRKRSDRPKPYIIPHPTTRSPRRSHVMPGGFGSDDLTLDRTTTATSDAFWKNLKSAVDMGYRLVWTQN